MLGSDLDLKLENSGFGTGSEGAGCKAGTGCRIGRVLAARIWIGGMNIGLGL